MDGINKIISFVLGLIVVAIFLVIISGRLQLGKKFFTASRGSATTSTPKQNTPTVAPSVKVTAKPTGRTIAQNKTLSPTKTVGNVKTIPNTGPDSLMTMLMVSAVVAGIGLWKMSEV